MRRRYEVDGVVDSEDDDADEPLERAPLPPVRRFTAPVIGTRTLGRPRRQVLQTTGKWALSLSIADGRPDPAQAFLIVLEVVDESPAWNQGLRPGDLFIQFGDLDRLSFRLCGSSLSGT